MYWSPSSIPYVYNEKKPLIQKQKTFFLDKKLVTITVPILDEENNVKYVIQSVRDDDESLYKKLAPVPNAKENMTEVDTSLIYKSDSMKKNSEIC